jgi:hypothetical protein
VRIFGFSFHEKSRDPGYASMRAHPPKNRDGRGSLKVSWRAVGSFVVHNYVNLNIA